MAKPIIFVIGASGNIGSATIQALSTKYADKLEIRAGVRNPDKLTKLNCLSPQLSRQKWGQKEKLKETLKGVDALFIVTAGGISLSLLCSHFEMANLLSLSLEHQAMSEVYHTSPLAKYADKLEIRAGVRNPDKADKIKLPGVTIVQQKWGQKEKLKETLKGVDALFIVTPGVENRGPWPLQSREAAKETDVKFILVVSVLTNSLTDTIFGRQFTELEGKVSSLGVPYAFLRLPLFVDNKLGIQRYHSGPVYLLWSLSPDKPFTPVVVEDAGNAAAVILSDYTKHTNKTYSVVSDRYTHSDLAKAFTEGSRKRIKYVQVPYDACKRRFLGKGYPEWQVDGILEIFKLIDNDSCPPVNNQADLSVYKTLTGEEPTSIKA
ncbi:LOW QUALITY PROTEIN: NAD(P)H azoreductase-like, partial [Gigantopelta aegis]|uniref:LOW QUALITY PROTEIN: NAD(P)H azoreductase-like n=1 Tax=Gigantopelta aegis TaxID=1735272 RepID=UPI001B88B15D